MLPYCIKHVNQSASRVPDFERGEIFKKELQLSQWMFYVYNSNADCKTSLSLSSVTATTYQFDMVGPQEQLRNSQVMMTIGLTCPVWIWTLLIYRGTMLNLSLWQWWIQASNTRKFLQKTCNLLAGRRNFLTYNLLILYCNMQNVEKIMIIDVLLANRDGKSIRMMQWVLLYLPTTFS